ncbi:protein of unknown function DUF362 [Isosphaera pallida ATCC 43644]|jgi:uncharacterized protein (DUF362 family)|uniref:DUF362 domain-containing protein n=1 Tax=Isosphaera pallida (strain ATCC 43644 / DSM 9630 / IS1B) TaxID=575540 RepID=E8R0P1_ISOPI|nr:DUF362 domain-containing protein [Isosphaera pallida]ADV61226.1 protein of unknown function DUF362 [Isosphaera pallida ATCC 43644]
MSEKLTRTQLKNLERLGGVNPAEAPFSRRQFVTQVGGGLLAAGAVVGTGLAILDPWGMKAVEPPPPVRLKSYAVSGRPASRPDVVVVRSAPVRAESREVELALREEQAFRMVKAGMEALGGVESFITRGDVVVVKPNVAFDKNPDLAATTQPDTIAAVVRLCKAAGARKVIVCDNPINNPESCFFKTKVGDAARRAGAEVMLPQASYFEPLWVGGETIKTTWSMFYKPFREATKVIGVSPVKDHNLCKATVTIKNWYGLLGNPRNQFHQDIHGIISDFALMMKPTLVIADGRRLLMKNGPTGGSLNDVKVADAMVIGTEQVAVDSWCVTRLLEKKRHDIVYLDKAIQRNLGVDWSPNKLRDDVVVDVPTAESLFG